MHQTGVIIAIPNVQPRTKHRLPKQPFPLFILCQDFFDFSKQFYCRSNSDFTCIQRNWHIELHKMYENRVLMICDLVLVWWFAIVDERVCVLMFLFSSLIKFYNCRRTCLCVKGYYFNEGKMTKIPICSCISCPKYQSCPKYNTFHEPITNCYGWTRVTPLLVGYGLPWATGLKREFSKMGLDIPNS